MRQDACQDELGPEGAAGSEPRPYSFSAELILGNGYVNTRSRREDEGSGYKSQQEKNKIKKQGLRLSRQSLVSRLSIRL